MEALLKRYYTKVQYFIGSVMSVADLHRVQVYSSIDHKNTKETMLFFFLFISG